MARSSCSRRTRAERTTLASYIDSPNLNDHFRAAVLLFTGDDYDQFTAQLPANPTNQKVPELGRAPGSRSGRPILRNLGASYQTRLTLELIGGPGRRRHCSPR